MQDSVTDPIVHVPPPGKPPQEQSVIGLIRSIATDSATLVRQEIELARQEVTEAVSARLKAVGLMAAAGVMAVFALGFLAAAGAWALDLVLPAWTSRLIVGGVFLLLAAVAAMVGMRRVKKPPLAPEETKRTVKEDVEWARAQLKR